MGSRGRTVDSARDRGRDLTSTVLRELRDARIDRNLSGARVADALGCSQAQYSRIERGLTGGLTIEQAAVALAAVGLELSVRVFPGGRLIRDVAHTALINRLRATCHASVRVLTEVPLPGAADLRAWDVVLATSSWRHPVEVETRPRDRQALERRIALKARDGGFEAVSLVLLDSRYNREFVRVHADLLAARFPVPASVATAALRAGADPGRGSVILL